MVNMLKVELLSFVLKQINLKIVNG
jgi:ABC-type multidrug transport system fused ATPase/permease subunit